MKRIIVVLCLLAQSLSAQDSTAIQRMLASVKLNINAGGFYHFKSQGEVPIELPGYIKQLRVEQNNTFNRTWKYTTDNPLFHAAYFMGANFKFDIIEGFTVYSSFIGEHRGFSYGVNSRDNIMMFPQMKAAVNRRYPLFNKELRIFGSIGAQVNPRVHEGLMFYNIYQQGHDYNLMWGKLGLNYVQLNDLRNGIGLGIDDSFDAIAYFKALNISSSSKLDVRAGFSYLPPSYFWTSSDSYIFYNFSGGFYVPGKFRVYAQASVRPYVEKGPSYPLYQEINFSTEEKVGGLLGVEWTKNTRKLRLKTGVEYRYYGAGFNAGYKNTDVYYRDTSNKEIYANTLGRHFYPVMLYDRPFSQWAVYTEYQDTRRNIFNNVTSVGCNVQATYFFIHRMMLKADLDFNYIMTDRDGDYLYPFYQAGIGWEPLDNNFVMLYLTNKGMNLDVHYPTFNQYSRPHLALMLKRDLPLDWFEN